MKCDGIRGGEIDKDLSIAGVLNSISNANSVPGQLMHSPLLLRLESNEENEHHLIQSQFISFIINKIGFYVKFKINLDNCRRTKENDFKLIRMI